MDISSATEPRLWLIVRESLRRELFRDGGQRLAGDEAIGLESPLLMGFELGDGNDRAVQPPAVVAVFPFIEGVNFMTKKCLKFDFKIWGLTRAFQIFIKLV